MMKEADKIIGHNIQSRRELLSLTQEDLANELKIPCQEIEAFENGVKPASPDILIRIARLFHCTLDALCGFTPSTYTHQLVSPDDILEHEIPPVFSHISDLGLRKFLYRTFIATMMLDCQKRGKTH